MENFNELNRLIHNLVRKGVILEVDHAAAKCRVKTGDLVTTWIRWLSFAAGDTRAWHPPTPGEQILLLSPGGDPADAIALCGIYSTEGSAPSNNPDLRMTRYPDGAEVEYDHAQHAMKITLPAGATVYLVAPGSVEVHTADAKVVADTVTLDTPSATITGNLRVDGGITAGANIEAAQDVKAGAISLKNHKHQEMGDGKPPGPAQ